MKLTPLRLPIWRLMFAVAVAGIAMAFLNSLVTFLDSPFLGPDPDGIAEWAPLLFLLRASSCGAALWAFVWLRRRMRRRAEQRVSSLARTACPDTIDVNLRRKSAV